MKSRSFDHLIKAGFSAAVALAVTPPALLHKIDVFSHTEMSCMTVQFGLRRDMEKDLESGSSLVVLPYELRQTSSKKSQSQNRDAWRIASSDAVSGSQDDDEDGPEDREAEDPSANEAMRCMMQMVPG
jgi:hypothetical protein